MRSGSCPRFNNWSVCFSLHPGIGNLIDRLFNNGFAIDFMNLGIGSLRTGIFNVADVFVITGAAIFMLSSLKDQTKTTTTQTL
jgi:signal peptidase II